jgi:hypothetical protein
MTVRRGINILDLLPLTTGLASSIPDGIVEQIAPLNVLDHRSTISPAFYLHEGRLQSLADQFDLNTANWALSVPGVATGLPFRLAVTRPAPTTTAGAFNGEAVPALWSLDIDVNPVVLVIPWLNAATIVDNDPMRTPSLRPVAGSPRQRRVVLQASCVLRISGGGAGGTQVQLMDAPDPLDPNAPSGATVRADMRPNTAVFGNSQYGMKLDSLVVDLSRQYTPAAIEARGHDEGWTGMSLKELTVFLPLGTPIVDNLTVGVRDLLLGSPFGMQGEAIVDFSKDFPDTLNDFVTIEQYRAGAAPDKISGSQVTDNPPVFDYPVAPDEHARQRRIRAVFDLGADLPGVADTKVIGVWWEIPGGAEGNSATTPWFDAPTDAVLRYRLRIVDATLVGQPAAQPSLPSAVPDAQTELRQVTARFPRLAGSPSGNPPIVDASIAGSTYHNTIHLRGPRALLTGVTFNTRGAINVRWQLGRGSAPVLTPSAASFSLALLPAGNGPFELMATDDNGDPLDTQGVRRIRIDLVPSGPLLIGHQESSAAAAKGVVSMAGATDFLQPTVVTDTFLSREYHVTGVHQSAPTPATLAGRRVNLVKGASAEVEVAAPNDDGASPPAVVPPTYTQKAVQVLFEYGQSHPVRVASEAEIPGPAAAGQNALLHQPLALPLALDPGRGGPAGSDLHQQLTAWVNDLPADAGGSRRYYVVGRTDDLWYGADAATNASENAELASARMNAAVAALGKVVDPVKILSRIETASATGWPTTAQGAPERMLAPYRLALPPGADPLGQPYADSGTGGRPQWRRFWERDAIDDSAVASQHARARADQNRLGYRCAEIFAVDPAAAADIAPPHLGGAASLVTIMVPGEDGALSQLVVSSPKDARTDYRVRLKARWDSPTVSGAADAIPTLAEALIRLKATDIKLPAVGSNPPPAVASTQPSGPSYWEVLLSWAYDASTGQTEASGALSIPHGKLQLISDVWAGAFAFGPALAAKLDAADVTGSEAGDFIAGLACIAAGAAIGAFINKDAVTGDHHGSVIFDKFTIGYTWNGAPHASATLDYTVDLRVKTGISGVFTVNGHLKLAYKNVGVLFDGNTKGGLEDVSFGMKELAVQVVDPGTWSLGGPLGDLIRVAATRMGNGSEWMEFDLEFAIDLGVVRLEGAVIRMRFAPNPSQSSVELRGLTAVVEVPQTLTGRGSATIGDGGAFRAMLGLEVIPAKLSAYGSIAVDQDFVAIEVGIQLPVGIPLGGTGFGLFGFIGRFVANGTRDLSKCGAEDPVEKQLQWYALAPIDKYKRLSGQYAFGVGAVIGTLPDGGYSFNAEGALTLGFPDISVVFSIDAHLIKQRSAQAVSRGSATPASDLRILGMVVIESDAVMVAVRTTYKIPNLLELRIPISAYFPTDSSKAWYIRIGSDNGPGRPGDPISLTLFPQVLDVRAWAFVMFEERQLHGLGGAYIPSWANVPSLDFEGFSIGLGAGFDLSWSAGPFSLSISAFMVVGLGTKPLLCAGAAGVAGSLDLVAVSLDVNGSLYFIVGEQHDPYAEGHFCASIDCWLFEIEGCVDITIGAKASDAIPAPASPIAGLDLCDHFAIVKGKAQAGSGAVPVVWPNTVGVLKFAHYIDDRAGSATGFVRKLASPAPLGVWSGSNQLKYAFRLTGIELFKKNGAAWDPVAGPFDSVWWLPTHRKATIEAPPAGIPPSVEEGRELGLWTIDPAPWAKWLTGESLGVPGNPAGTMGTLCDPVSGLQPSCAYGRERVYASDAFGGFKAQAPSGSVYPSSFLAVARLHSTRPLAQVVAIGAAAGYNYVPGAVAPLAAPFDHDGVHLEQGWRFPAFRMENAIAGTVPLALAISRVLVQGELYLQVCTERRVLPPPAKRVCDSMPRENGIIESFSGESSAVYRGKLECLAVGVERAVRLSGLIEAVHGDGPVEQVALWLDPHDGVALLTVLDAADKVLGQARTKGPGRQWLTLAAPGIVRARLEPVNGRPADLFTACWGPAGAQPEPVRVCDRMPATDGPIGGFVGDSGAVYEGGFSGVAIGSDRAIVVEGKFFGQRQAAPVPEVSVELDPREAVAVLIAFDAANTILARVPSSGNGRQWLTLRQPGIARIAIEAEPKRTVIHTVCWGSQWPSRPPTIHDLLGIEQLAAPRVLAIDAAGHQLVLEGVASVPAAAQGLCRVMAYTLPHRDSGQGWVSIQVDPWYHGDLSLVALCGVTADAAIAQEKDKAFTASLIELLKEQSKAVEDDQPTQKTYLDAASGYKLRVTWQWAGWRPASDGADPPATPSGWSGDQVDEFRFDTAAFGVTNPATLPGASNTTLDMDPAQGGPGYDERSFDPRGLSRFIAHTYPTHEDPPHFLDDAVGFWFTANHLQSLVAKYDGRELKCKVYHTRPRAGSLHGVAEHVSGKRHALDRTFDEPGAPGYLPDNPKWALTTAAIAAALEALPCIDVAPGSGGSQVTVKADLEPNSEYDLLLNTVKPGDSAVPEVLVARSHFRTSRYRNPEGLLRALGFTARAGSQTPNDFITTYNLQADYGPSAALRTGDAAFDEALKRCGMDPWPLPPLPRTTLIWRATGDAGYPWQVAAILLEADEPVWRAGMRTGALGKPAPPARVEVQSLEVYRNWDEPEVQGDGSIKFVPKRARIGDGLREVVRNSAGTRVLFAAGSGAVAPGTAGGLFDVQLRFNENGAAGAIGLAALFNRPAIVAQEL